MPLPFLSCPARLPAAWRSSFPQELALRPAALPTVWHPPLRPAPRSTPPGRECPPPACALGSGKARVQHHAVVAGQPKLPPLWRGSPGCRADPYRVFLRLCTGGVPWTTAARNPCCDSKDWAPSPARGRGALSRSSLQGEHPHLLQGHFLVQELGVQCGIVGVAGEKSLRGSWGWEQRALFKDPAQRPSPQFVLSTLDDPSAVKDSPPPPPGFHWGSPLC